jgi:hypothetical protein
MYAHVLLITERGKRRRKEKEEAELCGSIRSNRIAGEERERERVLTKQASSRERAMKQKLTKTIKN